jgi:uncharacterized YigZ family protein
VAEGYAAPVREARAEIRDRGSRFLAVVAPAPSEENARAVLEAVTAEFSDASHHCWACRAGWPHRQDRFVERSSDAGEPSGTAGIPILQVLRGSELSDVVAVVVRWFGGTKLGKGGLARAYAGATREAVATLSVVRRVPSVTLEIELPYERLGATKRLIRPPAVELRDESYGAGVRLVLEVHESERSALDADLADLGLEARESSL